MVTAEPSESWATLESQPLRPETGLCRLRRLTQVDVQHPRLIFPSIFPIPAFRVQTLLTVYTRILQLDSDPVDN